MSFFKTLGVNNKLDGLQKGPTKADVKTRLDVANALTVFVVWSRYRTKVILQKKSLPLSLSPLLTRSLTVKPLPLAKPLFNFFVIAED